MGTIKTTSPSDDECIALGKDLKKWATEKTQEWRCLLGQWWCLKHGMTRNEWNCLKQVKVFLPYYEAAQQALAVKCVNGTMKEGFAQRYIRLYDRELHDHENEIAAKKRQDENDIAKDLREIAQALANNK